MKKTKSNCSNTGTIRGIPYDSNEELYFFQWCFELLDRGYISSIERAEPYSLSDSVTNDYIKRLKTKSKPMSQKIMEGHVYTPEVKILWTEKALPLLWIYGKPIKKEKSHLFVAHLDNIGKLFSIIEIKPMFDFKNMERLVRLNIKWVLQKHGEWVNLIKNEQLFPVTFTPKAYLTTRTGKKRKIKWKIKTVEQFINNSEHGRLCSKMENNNSSHRGKKSYSKTKGVYQK